MQQIHLIKRLKNAACTCRSSLPTYASCWESHLPRGAAALLTFRGMLGPCSWRKRAGQVCGQTASPTSSSWTASITEQEPGMNHDAEGAQKKWKQRHVSVSFYHQLFARYDSDDTLIEWVTCRLWHLHFLPHRCLGLLFFVFSSHWKRKLMKYPLTDLTREISVTHIK